MKNFIVMALAIFFISSCTNKEQFVLNGKIENAGDLKKVYLYEGNAIIDSAFLNESNEFRFRRSAVEPRIYTLDAGQAQYLFVLQNGENVSFATDFSKDPLQYVITGSEVSGKIEVIT